MLFIVHYSLNKVKVEVEKDSFPEGENITVAAEKRSRCHVQICSMYGNLKLDVLVWIESQFSA